MKVRAICELRVGARTRARNSLLQFPRPRQRPPALPAVKTRDEKKRDARRRASRRSRAKRSCARSSRSRARRRAIDSAHATRRALSQTSARGARSGRATSRTRGAARATPSTSTRSQCARCAATTPRCRRRQARAIWRPLTEATSGAAFEFEPFIYRFFRTHRGSKVIKFSSLKCSIGLYHYSFTKAYKNPTSIDFLLLNKYGSLSR